jgi:hypothetical protein
MTITIAAKANASPTIRATISAKPTASRASHQYDEDGWRHPSSFVYVGVILWTRYSPLSPESGVTGDRRR